MKFAVVIEYEADKKRLKPFTRLIGEYLRRFLENGQLRAAGPFAEDAGALWISDAESAEAVEESSKEIPTATQACS